ncbi:MAG: DUF5678 domain-containing protein [Acidobacteriota bacterium]|nr:DUF5678 domain-containing protein [Acidobacteriota bacterium]
MATLEQILREARSLPVAEQRKLRDELDRDLQAAPAAYNTHEREHAWIEAHRDEYLGQWVALDGDRLIAHGTNAREVYLAAREKGVKAPFLEQMMPSLEPYMGGWA